ncbi:UNVERIFIED_CONTAM: hypothetical protein FKN15_059241 [Acipenser sinensis]
MASLSVCQPQCGGFSFENSKRNALLEAEFTKLGHSLPAARKTGTTICGVVFKDGVVLGADTRATEGMIVADKNCSKIHYISPNIYCCGAGTAADTEMTTQIISSNLELHALSTGRPSRVATANRMLKQMLFRYQGYIGAALVLGGVDSAGPHLYSIYPHGSTDKLPYVTMVYECDMFNYNFSFSFIVFNSVNLNPLRSYVGPGPSRVATANRMLKQMLFRYQGYIGAALVLGGVDSAGPHLYSIYPHGSTDKLPYVTMGKWQSKCIIIALYNTAVCVIKTY